MSTNRTLVIAAASVTLLVATSLAVYFLAPVDRKQVKASSSASKGELQEEQGEEEEDDELPKVPKEELIRVFSQITQQMEKVIFRISQLEQQILQRAQQNDEEIDQNELRESMMNEFFTAMKDVEHRVYEHVGVTEIDVEVATAFYSEDPDFQQVLKTLRRKYSLFTGQGVEDVPDYVTMELIMDVMSETMTKMTSAMEEVFALTKAEFQPGTEQFAQTLQQRYVEKIGVLRQEVQTKYNIDQDLLQAGVIKYQNNPEFQAKMVQLTTEQSEAYKRLGLA
ncbi:hypothetical protein BASA81_006426 [Batrachochytrium salamandrivorans]|nr:hypothetical protein BASA81_006426 [Batrachochytrium salamandrivorans]